MSFYYIVNILIQVIWTNLKRQRAICYYPEVKAQILGKKIQRSQLNKRSKPGRLRHLIICKPSSAAVQGFPSSVCRQGLNEKWWDNKEACKLNDMPIFFYQLLICSSGDDYYFISREMLFRNIKMTYNWMPCVSVSIGPDCQGSQPQKGESLPISFRSFPRPEWCLPANGKRRLSPACSPDVP